jgi:hypothetical protein
MTQAMVQSLPFRHPGTAADVRSLCDQLALLFRACPALPQRDLVVWNLACGRADESGALAAALQPARIGHYLGIDLRGHCIREARQRWKIPGGVAEFIEGDASAIPAGIGPAVPDIIFIRHQNYWHEPQIWDRIFSRALACLADHGILACTSYFDREHALMTSALRTLGAVLATDFKNPESRPLSDAPGKSVDRHLAAFVKLPLPPAPLSA